MDREWNTAVRAFREGDLAGALVIFKKLASKGSIAALVEVGNIYELGGGGVIQNYAEARRWYERAVNEGDSAVACLRLGNFHYAGLGVQQNFDNAFFYFSQLDDSSEPSALYLLGKMYEMGHGVEQDFRTAMTYYQRAATLGSALAYRDIAFVQLKQGHYLAGSVTWFKACVKIFRIALRDPNDRRIKLS